MFIALLVVALLVAAVWIFLQQAKFGRLPAGQRLEQVRKSPNFREGQFQNVEHTPAMTEGVSYFKVLKQFFFEKHERIKPTEQLPAVRTDLHQLDPGSDVLIWFGHSSYFIQIGGRKILVDPVFSTYASPLPRGLQAFNTSFPYRSKDMPAIDYLFLTHDHWDHLNYETLVEMKLKIKTIICPLGVASHLERWGFDQRSILEKDWNETLEPEPGFVVNTVTARHFSGRSLKRNQTLWTAFALKTAGLNIFIGGDSGYGKHFAETGKNLGPFDLAILENGQYNAYWKYIHMMPEEVLQAAKDLNARRVLPVHSGKFNLATHPWDEPLKRIAALAQKNDPILVTPRIGELVDLRNDAQQFTNWWENIN